jgi:hypothetical protein
MESNQRPRTERLTEASPPGRATEAHGDARAPLTTKPSSSSPSVGIKKAPTGRASSPSLSPRSIKLPPSRRPPSVASSSADGDNRKVPKPWWEALARLASELRGEAAAQRAAHTTDLGILQQQQLALRARSDRQAAERGRLWRRREHPGAQRRRFGCGRPAAAVVETASDAQALLSLLERGAAVRGGWRPGKH